MAKSNAKQVRASEAELKDKLVAINRVTKVTKGGRNFSFSAMVVVGDENGVVGHGLGKANEVTEAITKGIDLGKKNCIKVPIINGTVPHEMTAKFSGAEVFMRPAAHGTGVIAGGAMRAVFESVGIKDVLAKSKGSSNPQNVVKATILALSQMRDAYTVADQRGIELDKVFNGQTNLDKMAIVKIKQIKSKIKQPARQKKTLTALGVRKMHKVVEHEATPQIMGMIAKVQHLLSVEEAK